MVAINVSCRLVTEMVSISRGLPRHRLYSARHCREEVEARRLAWTLARYLTDRSLKTIGRAMGGYDHSTVHEGISVCERSLDQRIDLAAEFSLLAGMIEFMAEETPPNINDAAEAVVHGWRQLAPATRKALEASLGAALNHLQTIVERH